MTDRPFTRRRFHRAAFSRLAGAATISGLGDGMTQVAGALLAVSLTSSPLRIAGLLAAQQLPWVLGALPAGALVDRVDRRRAMAAACLARAAALGTLGLLAAAGRAGLPVMYAVFLVTGAAGVVYENAATAIVPVLVARPELTRANGRLQAASSLSRSLLAQPLGAWLLAFLSANLAVFSSVGATLRQSLAPPGMLGRVQGAYRAISTTGLLAGAALGGLLTSVAGLTAPLWLGLGAITMVIVLAWRPFGALGTAGVSATAP
jgi:MFS family permease